jgi:hypothetical protein
MSASLRFPKRGFQSVQFDLEETVVQLKTVFDPSTRRKLLRNLRVLLEEADSMIHSEHPEVSSSGTPALTLVKIAATPSSQ